MDEDWLMNSTVETAFDIPEGRRYALRLRNADNQLSPEAARTEAIRIVYEAIVHSLTSDNTHFLETLPSRHPGLAYQRLRKYYCSNSKAAVRARKKKFQEMVMPRGGRLSRFAADIFHTAAEIRSHGHDVSESDMIDTLFNGILKHNEDYFGTTVAIMEQKSVSVWADALEGLDQQAALMEEELAAIPGSQVNFMSAETPKENPPMPPCRQFARTGTCSYGDSCKFNHDQAPANPPTSCSYCRRRGHKVQTCRKKAKDEKAKGNDSNQAELIANIVTQVLKAQAEVSPTPPAAAAFDPGESDSWFCHVVQADFSKKSFPLRNLANQILIFLLSVFLMASVAPVIYPLLGKTFSKISVLSDCVYLVVYLICLFSTTCTAVLCCPHSVPQPEIFMLILEALQISAKPNDAPASTWILDSGANVHICTHRDSFLQGTLRPCKKTVHVAKGAAVIANEVGDLLLRCQVNGKLRALRLTNVLYIPGVSHNLVGIPALDRLGLKTTFCNGKATVLKNGAPCLTATLRELYFLDLHQA